MSIFRRATMRSSRLCAAVWTALLLPLPVAAGSADDSPVATLDAVEVHGERDEALVERALTPGGVAVLDGEALHRRQVGHLADALRYVPGVWAQSTAGGDAVFVSSRGSNLDATYYDGNGVRLLQDGLPVSAADGSNHNRFPDPLAARSAVVARGANALAYGASNLGGAIDLATPTARDGTPSQLFVTAGSHGLASARLTAGGVSGDLDGLVTLEARRRDGYRQHGREDRAGLYANAGWRASEDLALRVHATYIDSDEQLAGALDRAQFDADPYRADPSAISGHYQLNVRSSRLAATGDWRMAEARRLRFGLSYEEQHLYHPIVDRVMVDFDGPGPLEPVEVFSLLKNTDQRSLGGMLRYGARIGAHDVLAGVNLAYSHETGGNYRNDGGRRNGRFGSIDNRADSLEVFVLDRWRFAPEWTLVYGAQGVLTGRDVRAGDLDSGTVRVLADDYASFNPRVGVIRALGPHGEAFASLGRLYEAPTNFELEDDARGGEQTLAAMRGEVIEAGLRGEVRDASGAARWRWDMSAYYARIRDAILSIDDPAAPGTSLSANVPRTVHAGVEALLGASFALGGGAHRIEPLLALGWNAFSFDRDPHYGDNRLPAAPSYAIRGEVMYRGTGGIFAGPTFDLVGARYADFGNDYRVGGHGLVGLRAGVERARWEAFAELRNLLDRRHVGMLMVRDRAGADAAVLHAGEPRSLYLGLRLRL